MGQVGDALTFSSCFSAPPSQVSVDLMFSSPLPGEAHVLPTPVPAGSFPDDRSIVCIARASA